MTAKQRHSRSGETRGLCSTVSSATQTSPRSYRPRLSLKAPSSTSVNSRPPWLWRGMVRPAASRTSRACGQPGTGYSFIPGKVLIQSISEMGLPITSASGAGKEAGLGREARTAASMAEKSKSPSGRASNEGSLSSSRQPPRLSHRDTKFWFSGRSARWASISNLAEGNKDPAA